MPAHHPEAQHRLQHDAGPLDPFSGAAGTAHPGPAAQGPGRCPDPHCTPRPGPAGTLGPRCPACPSQSCAIGPHCGMRCHNDTACRSGEKCCPRGCCTRCVLAEPAKRGFCPRKRAHRSAAACPNRCTDDRDCPGEHKCCFSGCGLACTPPDTGLFPWPQVGSACPHCGVWPPTACWSSLEGI
uniref:WAP domain-containing protein n=1 Tax=Malurus cyaneus samueli TaxID=2593467 RepID=A0A8C5TRD0_9PASS